MQMLQKTKSREKCSSLLLNSGTKWSLALHPVSIIFSANAVYGPPHPRCKTPTPSPENSPSTPMSVSYPHHAFRSATSTTARRIDPRLRASWCSGMVTTMVNTKHVRRRYPSLRCSPLRNREDAPRQWRLITGGMWFIEIYVVVLLLIISDTSNCPQISSYQCYPAMLTSGVPDIVNLIVTIRAVTPVDHLGCCKLITYPCLGSLRSFRDYKKGPHAHNLVGLPPIPILWHNAMTRNATQHNVAAKCQDT